MRRKCVRHGHDFREWQGAMLPVLFCRRWRCKASRPAPWVQEPLYSALMAECNRHDRA